MVSTLERTVLLASPRLRTRRWIVEALSCLISVIGAWLAPPSQCPAYLRFPQVLFNLEEYPEIYMKLLLCLQFCYCYHYHFQLSCYCLFKATVLQLPTFSSYPHSRIHRFQLQRHRFQHHQPFRVIEKHLSQTTASPSCASVSPNATRSAIASTTTTPFNRVLRMVTATTELKRGWSLSAMPVLTIQCRRPNPPQVRTITRTLATPPGQADREQVRVGDEREYYTGFPLRTLRSAQASGESDCHERRWQYA